MNIKIFNLCVWIGWTMVTAGSMLYSLPVGLVTGGVLLLVLTLAAAYLGGLVDPSTQKAPRAGEGA